MLRIGSDRTSSVPSSVLRLKVDKGQSLRSDNIIQHSCIALHRNTKVSKKIITGFENKNKNRIKFRCNGIDGKE